MQNCLIKLSGDMLPLSRRVLVGLEQYARRYYTVVLVGGGIQLNKAGLGKCPRGPLGRELPDFEDRQLARNLLEHNQAYVQDALLMAGFPCAVEIPVLYVAGVLCHVDGDEYVKAAYNGFDKLVVVTTQDRLQAKQDKFAPFPKVEVKSFEASNGHS